LPTEGSSAGEPRAGSVARDDVPTCALDERLGDVAARVRDAGWDACVVVNEARVVLGLLRERELDGEPDRAIEEAMRPGPSTFRPHVSVFQMAKYMEEHDLVSAPITTGDGELVGLLRREDAVRVAAEAHRHEHHDEGDHG
jgi:Mg/Co/Ni transporter MgtE